MVHLAPTHPQLNVLRAIRAYWDTHDYAPAVRDLAAALNTSTSTVQYHLDRLEAHGWIARDANVARSIRVLDPIQAERTPYDTGTAQPDRIADQSPGA